MIILTKPTGQSPIIFLCSYNNLKTQPQVQMAPRWDDNNKVDTSLPQGHKNNGGKLMECFIFGLDWIKSEKVKNITSKQLLMM